MSAGERCWRYVELACRWGLALIFLWAGVPKLVDPGGFAEVVAAYGLVPDPLVGISAVLVAALEVVAGIGLVFARPWAARLAAALMLLFIVVLSVGIRMGLDIDCGCFPEDSAAHDAFSGLRAALVRDLFLLLPLAFLLLRSRFNQTQRKERMS